MKINIYIDGAYSSKTNYGGWAVVALPVIDTSDDPGYEHHCIYSGYEKNTTNNRMELTALKKALEYILTYPMPTTIYCDSAYIVNCFKQKWYITWYKNGWRTSKKTPVLNADLWIDILRLYEKTSHYTTIEKIDGHSGHMGNEMADRYAVMAREEGAESEKNDK